MLLALKQGHHARPPAGLGNNNVVFWYRYPIFVTIERLRDNDDAALRLTVVKRIGLIID